MAGAGFHQLDDREVVQRLEQQEFGLVIRTGPGTYLVRYRGRAWTCRISGRLRRKRERLSSESVCIGDHVVLDKMDESTSTAFISEILPRSTSLARLSPPPWPGAARIPQVLAVNVNLLVVVMAAVAPPLKMATIDRYLLLARQAGINATVCINKIDQAGMESAGKSVAGQGAAEARAFALDGARRVLGVKDELEARGVRVILTSAEKDEGIGDLRALLEGKTSVFAGPSGVGKTSLLKKLCPGLEGKTLAINATTGKGRHSTTFSSLVDVGSGYVADLPGLRALGFWNLEEATVRREFPDIEELARLCRFRDCTHTHEPGCAVKAAVERGEIEEKRHAEYARVMRDAGRRRR